MCNGICTYSIICKILHMYVKTIQVKPKDELVLAGFQILTGWDS